MKLCRFAILALFAVTSAVAEEPSLNLYQFIRKDHDNGPDSGEVILKLNNPSNKPIYTLGLFLTDVQHTVQILRDGKWSDSPIQTIDHRVNPAFRPILPGSYIVFEAHGLPWLSDGDQDLTFRIRAVVHTEPRFETAGEEPRRKTWIELFSPVFTTKELRPTKVPSPAAPEIPGLDSLPTAK